MIIFSSNSTRARVILSGMEAEVSRNEKKQPFKPKLNPNLFDSDKQSVILPLLPIDGLKNV